jgi:hypothetical protein
VHEPAPVAFWHLMRHAIGLLDLRPMVNNSLGHDRRDRVQFRTHVCLKLVEPIFLSVQDSKHQPDDHAKPKRLNGA